jgi:hypothetical protein
MAPTPAKLNLFRISHKRAHDSRRRDARRCTADSSYVNLDLPTVQSIIRHDKNEINVKTVSKPHFISQEYYGKKVLTPLELALFQQKEIENDLKKSPNYLPFILCLEQIKEIVAFLQQSLGMTAMNNNVTCHPFSPKATGR